MGARREETPAVHSSGEPVTTKLHRIAEKARKEAVSFAETTNKGQYVLILRELTM